jgi:hypothetical protein
MLLGLFGLALIIAGIFVTDPGLGYPPGVPTPANPTGHGVVHALAGLFDFILLPIATFVMSRRFAGDPAWRGWALYSLLTGIIMIASFIICQWLGTIQNVPVGLGKPHWDYRLLGLDLAARDRALEERARARSDSRLHPSLNLAWYGLVFLPVCTRGENVTRLLIFFRGHRKY